MALGQPDPGRSGRAARRQRAGKRPGEPVRKHAWPRSRLGPGPASSPPIPAGSGAGCEGQAFPELSNGVFGVRALAPLNAAREIDDESLVFCHLGHGAPLTDHRAE